MRIVVCPAQMEVGGSQTNAIELAAGVAGLGHEVVMYGPPGVLVARVAELGLEYVQAATEMSWPSLANQKQLTRLVRDRGIEVVHAYEWGPLTDALYGPYLRLGTPSLVTIMSMEMPPFLPRAWPLVVGTKELAEQERRAGADVHLLEPPIDTDANVAAGRGADFRRKWGIATDEILVVSVSRLAHALKLESLLCATRTINSTTFARPVRLVIVGDGPAREEIAEAARVSGGAPRTPPPVVLTGELLDPRAAYEAADIVIGMGGSALRAMSFSKPLIVAGEQGFWELLTEATLPMFLSQGWYGVGMPGDPQARLRDLLARLVDEPQLRAELGALGRRVVCERFSLREAIAWQEDLYRATLAARRSRPAQIRATARPTWDLMKFKAARARAGLGQWRAGQRSPR